MRACSDPPAGTRLVYRWPDGSDVHLRFVRWGVIGPDSGGPWMPGQGVVQLLVRSRSAEGSVTWVTLSPNVVEGPVLYVQNDSIDRVEKNHLAHWSGADLRYSSGLSLMRDLSKKLRGLALDLGADRGFRQHKGLLPTHQHDPASVVPMPRWVADEEWDRRFETATSRHAVGALGRTSVQVLLAAKDLPPFLGWLPGLTLQTEEAFPLRGRPATKWHAHSTSGDGSSSDSGHWVGWSLEEAVNKMLDDEAVAPASRRPVWEAENVERGELVLPSEEEAELFRALGERLPLFWRYEELRSWVLEREP